MLARIFGMLCPGFILRRLEIKDEIHIEEESG